MAQRSIFWPFAVLLLFIAALAWRLLYLERLASTPLADSLTQDSETYWRWAGLISLRHPLGRDPFFLGPLYPYVLALLRVFTGDSVLAVLRLQAAWGALAVVLLADAARRLAGAAAGLAAGVVLAFYEMAVFFDGLVLMESLLFFLEALLLWRVARADWSRPRAWLGLGMLVGLLAEGRATAALLLPAALVLLPGPPATWRQRVRGPAALLAGLIVVATPVAVRTWAVSHEWIPFTYNLGYNLYVGNNPQATGGFVPITGTHEISAPPTGDGGAELDGREYLRETEHVTLTARQSSDRWAGKALRWMRSTPGQAAALLARKLGMLWNRREYAQIENADEYRQLAGPLGLPWLGRFAFLGALAVAGLWFAWRAGPRGRFLVCYTAAVTLGVVPFFVTDRYRHHLVPAAALLAALALRGLWRAALESRRRRRALWTLAVPLLAGVLVVNLPAPGLGRTQYAWRVAADVGSRLLAQGRPDLAVPRFEEALRIHGTAPAAREAQHAEAGQLAELYYDYARALVKVGRGGESLAWYEKAFQRVPDNAVVVEALAGAYRNAGRTADAERLEGRLASLVGGEGRALESRAWSAARAGRFDEAEGLFTRAVRSDPTLYDSWAALVRLQAQAGRLDQARATLEAARRQRMPAVPLHAHAALLAAAAGDEAGAVRELAQVPDAAAATDPVVSDVVRQTRALLARRH